MSYSSKRLSAFFLLLAGLSTISHASNVVVLPRGNTSSPVTIFNGNPFSTLTTVSTIGDPAFAVTNPTSTRTYLIGRSGTIAVLDNAAGFAEKERYSLASQVTDVAMTPDGKKLLVLAGDLRVIDLSVDRPSSIPTVVAGNLPNSVAVSIDSTRAFVTSAISRSITVVDLSNNTVLAQQTLNTTPNGIAVGPNGLVYIAATNHLLEFDGQNGVRYTTPNGYSFEADPTKPQFAPDGSCAVMLNRQVGGAIGVVVVDLKSRSVSTAPFPAGTALTQLTVVSESTAYAMGDGKLFVMSLTPATPPAPASSGAGEGLKGMSISNEAPSAKFLYLTNEATAMRLDLDSGPTAGPLTVVNGDQIIFTSTPSTDPVASLRTTALNVVAAPSATTLPLTVRALDGNRLPVKDALVRFSTSSPGVSLFANQATTNSNGIAAIRATMPSTIGSYTIHAASGSGSADIIVRVSSEAGGSAQFVAVSGNGQIVNAGSLSQPFQVKLTDTLGNPVSGATINWTLRSGAGVTLTAPTSITNPQGVATLLAGTSSWVPTSTLDAVRPFVISASISTGSIVGSVDLNGVVYPIPSEPPVVELTNNLNVSNGEIVLPAGGVIEKAFSARILTGLTAFPALPVPNVGMRATTPETTAPFAACRANPVSNPSGIVSCDLAVGSNLGATTLQIVIGESSAYTYSFPIRIIPGAPSKLTIIQGDGQSGNPGAVTPRALVIQVQDAENNPLTGVGVTWTITAGDGVLVDPRDRTDGTGNASTLVRFGSTPGNITVRAAVGGLQAVFTLSNNTPLGSFVVVAGDGQSASVNSNFITPLTVRATNPSGDPLVGAVVNFTTLSGPVTVSSPTATTDVQGIASVTAFAGANAGSAQVRASIGGATVTFTLNVGSPGPRIDSVLNGASFREGVAACSVAVIKGTGFTQGLSGVFSSGVSAIPVLPYSLKGVSVQVNGISAPLYYVSNIDGTEQIGIQIPCELANGANTVSVTALGQTMTKAITVADAAPGIFATEFIPGVNQGVVVKADGSYVSPTNPAVQGETLTGFFTGLMPTTQLRVTNAVGVGQSADTSRIIIGLNNAGMPVVSAQYAPNLIGVYTIRFIVDSTAGSGDKQAYAIGIIDAAGRTIYGNSSTLPVK